ncbi:MAG: hypothetical protein JWM98_2186 [Thermoleophilia bacterium]|nr:hypothetical protein [Thermoleophilia bacterium]
MPSRPERHDEGEANPIEDAAMQLATATARPTSFQRQLGEVVVKLEDALHYEDDTPNADRTFRAIDEGVETIGTALERKASSEAKDDARDAAILLGDSRDVIGTNWSLEPPHVSLGYGNVGRAGVREAVDLLKQAIAEA